MTSSGQKFMRFRKGLKAKKEKGEATDTENIVKNVGYSEKLNAKVLSHLVCRTATTTMCAPIKATLEKVRLEMQRSGDIGYDRGAGGI